MFAVLSQKRIFLFAHITFILSLSVYICIYELYLYMSIHTLIFSKRPNSFGAQNVVTFPRVKWAGY